MRIVVVGSDVDVGADVDTQTDGERLQAMCRPSIRPRSAITEARAGRRRLLEQGAAPVTGAGVATATGAGAGAGGRAGRLERGPGAAPIERRPRAALGVGQHRSRTGRLGKSGGIHWSK